MTVSLATIAPPPARAVRSNLIRSARSSDDQARWEIFGVTYQPLQHGDLDEDEDFGVFDPCNPGNVDVQDAPAPIEWKTVGLWVAAKCSAMGGDDVFADTAARARQRLAVQESHLLEHAFWTGALGNRALAAGDGVVTTPVGDTPVGIVSGFSELIRAMSDQLGGERGFIHVPAWLGPYLAFYGLAKVEANGVTVLTSINDHVIVLGTGYTGTGPGGEGEPGDQPAPSGAAWIYATPEVEVRLGPVRVDDDPAGMLNRANNTITAIAQRPGLAHFDGEAHIGVPVCLPDPGPECTPGS